MIVLFLTRLKSFKINFNDFHNLFINLDFLTTFDQKIMFLENFWLKVFLEFFWTIQINWYDKYKAINQGCISRMSAESFAIDPPGKILAIDPLPAGYKSYFSFFYLRFRVSLHFYPLLDQWLTF